jgi:signal transduction histidine kinase/ActR/RegA family two-component response regulator
MPDSAYTAAFDQAPLAMALLEPQAPFRAIVANAAFLRDVGRGSALDDLRRVGLRGVFADDERAATFAMLAQVAKDGAQRNCLEYHAADRSYWEICASSVDHDGMPALLYVGSDATARERDRGAAAVATDITHYRRVEESLRVIDEFLAMLSHELRTPLAPIMAWMQILKRAADPERVKAAIEVVERNVRLQTALIDDLLDLTAITRGKVDLEYTPQDFCTVVETAAETVRAKIAERGIVLVCELPDVPVVVEGDANRLQQVVWNLLTNAIKVSSDSAPVQVSLVTEGDAAVLRVRDGGTGIAPEFLPHVFDMFRQQERGARHSYGGLGIGLAIAKRVTELHRGTIEVRSDGVGHGAEFCVRLPLASSTPVNATASAAAFHSLPVTTVLLVEDAPDTREAAHALLGEMGVRVIDAAEGAEALLKLEQHAIDLVLCDLRMPLMDGFELIRRIREDPRHRGLPVIAVSGFATGDDEQHTRDAGFDAYVRKPFVESTLAAAVDRVLRQRRAERRRSTGA